MDTVTLDTRVPARSIPVLHEGVGTRTLHIPVKGPLDLDDLMPAGFTYATPRNRRARRSRTLAQYEWQMDESVRRHRLATLAEFLGL